MILQFQIHSEWVNKFKLQLLKIAQEFLFLYDAPLKLFYCGNFIGSRRQPRPRPECGCGCSCCCSCWCCVSVCFRVYLSKGSSARQIASSLHRKFCTPTRSSAVAALFGGCMQPEQSEHSVTSLDERLTRCPVRRTPTQCGRNVDGDGDDDYKLCVRPQLCVHCCAPVPCGSACVGAAADTMRHVSCPCSARRDTARECNRRRVRRRT